MKLLQNQPFAEDWIMDTEYSTGKVFEILGKTICVCQEIESLLKFVVPRTTIKLYPANQKNQAIINDLNEKMQSKDTLGMLSTKYLDEIYGSIPENQETSIQVSFRRSGDEEMRKNAFKNVVKIRNELVHSFSSNYDLTTEDSRKKTIIDLEEKYKAIENEYETLKNDLETYKYLINSTKNFVNSPAYTLQPLIDIYSETKDKDGWVSLSRAGRKLRENRFNSPELLQLIQEKKGLLNLIKTHGFFEVKNENNICKYRVIKTI
jgi:flagellar motility protein MotE (MotC chaperone)